MVDRREPVLKSGFELFSYPFRGWFKLFPASVRDVAEVRELLSLVPRNNVNVQMGNFLSRRVSVLLDDGDAVGFRGVPDGYRKFLRDFVNVADEVFGNVVDGFEMSFGNHERVSLVKRSNIEKRYCLVVFVDDAGRSFFRCYLAEDT